MCLGYTQLEVALLQSPLAALFGLLPTSRTHTHLQKIPKVSLTWLHFVCPSPSLVGASLAREWIGLSPLMVLLNLLFLRHPAGVSDE